MPSKVKNRHKTPKEPKGRAHAAGEVKCPERVFEKIEESRFFLARMADYEKRDQEFGYCLSAFLSGFKSIVCRLERSVGRTILPTVRQRLHSDPDIDFLCRARDIEVHSNGLIVFPIYNIERGEPRIPERWQSLWEPPMRRFNPIHPRSRIVQLGWQFSDHPARNVIELCYDTLNSIEQIVRDCLKN